MLFAANKSACNSLRNPRERNFYFKILGGYVFNELITNPPIPDRVNTFLDITPRYVDFIDQCEEAVDYQHEPKKTIRELLDIKEVDFDRFAVSFDNHLAFKDIKKESPAEFADIALWLNGDCLLAIEAKYTENWNELKDIKGNLNCLYELQKSGDKVSKIIDYMVNKPVFMLLILEEKLVSAKNRDDSVLNRLIDEAKSKEENSVLNKSISKSGVEKKIPTCIVTWDQIMEAMRRLIGESFESHPVNVFFKKSKLQMQAQRRIKVGKFIPNQDC